MSSRMKALSKNQNKGSKKPKDPRILNNLITFNDENKFKISFKLLPNKDVDDLPVVTASYYNVVGKGYHRAPAIKEMFGKSDKINDLRWEIYNFNKNVGSDKLTEVFRSLREREESFVNVFIVDAEDETLIGKTFIWRIPKVLKDSYIMKEWDENEYDLFEDSSSIMEATITKTGNVSREFYFGYPRKFDRKVFADLLPEYGTTIQDVYSSLYDLNEFAVDETTALANAEEDYNKALIVLKEVVDTIRTGEPAQAAPSYSAPVRESVQSPMTFDDAPASRPAPFVVDDSAPDADSIMSGEDIDEGDFF